MSSKNTRNNDDNYDEMPIKQLRNLLTLRGYDCSQCVEKSDLVNAARTLDNTDFDEEARKLFRQLNLPSRATSTRYSNLDAIWKHPGRGNNGEGGGTVYVGNAVAASDRRTLKERQIVAIINCQEKSSKNYFENESEFEYKRFLVSRLAYNSRMGGRSAPEDAPLVVLPGFDPIFDFIERHISQGNSVLIHCLAGAHRAGTTGVAWLMYKTGKGTEDALQLAKACRPIISPFGTLLECLFKLEHELQIKGIIPSTTGL